MRTTGHRGGLFISGGMLRCKMYDSWSAFRRGWKRIYTESANRKSTRLRQAAFRLRIAASVLPVFSLLALVTWWPFWHDAALWKQLVAIAIHGSAVLMWATASIAFARAGTIPWRTFPQWPLGAWRVADILAEAARDLEDGTPTEWGGRVYPRADRGPVRTHGGAA